MRNILLKYFLREVLTLRSTKTLPHCPKRPLIYWNACLHGIRMAVVARGGFVIVRVRWKSKQRLLNVKKANLRLSKPPDQSGSHRYFWLLVGLVLSWGEPILILHRKREQRTRTRSAVGEIFMPQIITCARDTQRILLRSLSCSDAFDLFLDYQKFILSWSFNALLFHLIHRFIHYVILKIILYVFAEIQFYIGCLNKINTYVSVFTYLYQIPNRYYSLLSITELS